MFNDPNLFYTKTHTPRWFTIHVQKRTDRWQKLRWVKPILLLRNWAKRSWRKLNGGVSTPLRKYINKSDYFNSLRKLKEQNSFLTKPFYIIYFAALVRSMGITSLGFEQLLAFRFFLIYRTYYIYVYFAFWFFVYFLGKKLGYKCQNFENKCLEVLIY